MKSSRHAPRESRDLRIRRNSLCIVLLLSFSTLGVYAQTSWNTTTGSFDTAGNWTSGVPNSTTSALITNGTSLNPSVVDLGPNSSDSVLDLTLDQFDALNVENNSQLNIYGASISNAGTITLAPAANNSTLQFYANTTLSGGGSVVISGNSVVNESGSQTLTNADNTIEGSGQVGSNGLKVTNESAGTITANVGGTTLSLNGGGLVTNSGMLEAQNGGNLSVTNSVANAGGTILSTGAGSTVEFSGTTITGGTLNTASGGVLGTGAGTSVTLDGSTVAGALTNAGTYLT
ncbi:MAG: hypothetical protein ACREFX_06845, partial [Opitutaceae bacterium]